VKGKPSEHPTSRFKRRAIPSGYGLSASRDQVDVQGRAAMVQQRRQAMREAAQMFADAGALRPDLDIEVAADLMWFYNDPSLYDKLVRQRGWSVDRFQAWLAEALQVQLLGKAPSVRTAE
jgi:hypothetical protein